jgi:hypothetical protein
MKDTQLRRVAPLIGCNLQFALKLFALFGIYKEHQSFVCLQKNQQESECVSCDTY